MSETTSPQPEVPVSARRLCYHGVRGAGAHAVAAYYKKHPHKIDDQCSEDLVKTVIDTITAVLAVLDGYDIDNKPADKT